MGPAPQNIYPVLRYRDAHAAIEFLCRAFGFERNAVYESEDGRSSMPSSPSAAAWSC